MVEWMGWDGMGWGGVGGWVDGHLCHWSPKSLQPLDANQTSVTTPVLVRPLSDLMSPSGVVCYAACIPTLAASTSSLFILQRVFPQGRRAVQTRCHCRQGQVQRVAGFKTGVWP
eukprot:349679-Chlamydomonas_euryale.AAC.9